MGIIHKTNTANSPLLEPVQQRDYTKGLDFSSPKPNEQQASPGPAPSEPKPGGQQPDPGPTATKTPGADFGAKSPDDSTKPFTFDEDTDNASDLKDGEESPGMTIPSGSAKTFANFVGNAIQLYLPKATYGYVKIDMENVIMNVEKGNLTTNWIDTFEKINKSTEEALAIPDESIKMWKAAFKDYLEYKNIALANPETAFIAATILLLADQGVRAYQIKKSNEKYMKEAIEASNPGLFAKSGMRQEPVNNEKKINQDEQRDRAA